MFSLVCRPERDLLLLGLLLLAMASQAQAQPVAPPTPPPSPGDPSRPQLQVDAGGFRQPQSAMQFESRPNATSATYAIPQISAPPPARYYANSGYAGALPPGAYYNSPGLGGGRGTGLGNAYAGYGQYMGATLSGSADVISADAQAQIAYQQSNLLGQQVKQAKLETKRKALEEWLYERAITPTTEDERERSQWEQLRRSRNNPPFSEIWSAKALNDLLDSIRKSYSATQQGPPVPIPSTVLPQINYTTGTTYVGAGLLKPGVQLPWPDALQDTGFDKLRTSTDELIAKALEEGIQKGRVTSRIVRDITSNLDALNDRVLALTRSEDLTPTDSIQAKRFLRELRASCAVLKQPNVGQYFAANSKPEANNVAGLIDQMNARGLRFAPAVTGNEESYNSLYQAMVVYEVNLAQMQGRLKTASR